MREESFKIPSVRKILELAGVRLPDRIRNWERFALELIDDGILVPVGNTYRKAVQTREKLDPGKIALYGSRFRVTFADSNLGIKSLDDLMKLDSQAVLRELTGVDDVPNRLTKEFLEKNRIWPFTLNKVAAKFEDVENPPIGPYWVGCDNHVRTTTWMRATPAAEMQEMKKRKHFQPAIIVDRKYYGRNMWVKVKSRTEEGKSYDCVISKLPVHLRADPSQYSSWINIENSTNDPDVIYRGREHDQRVHSIYFWSASCIFAFYEAMQLIKSTKDQRQFRINPFPIPRGPKDIKFIDDLRLNSLIFEEDGEIPLKVLNKTEIDKQIGARTLVREYEKCWTHWGSKNFSFLYTPN